MLDAILKDMDCDEQLRVAVSFADQPGILDDFFSVIRKAVAAGAEINGFDDNDRTVLMKAVEDGKPRVVQKLLDLGTDINIKNSEGYSAWVIHLLCLDIPHMAKEQAQIKQILIDAGADVSAEIPFKDLIVHDELDYVVLPHNDYENKVAQSDNPKWSAVLKYETNGLNFNVDTQEVIDTLEAWDKQFGIEISEVGHDRITVDFEEVPEDAVYALADEIYDFCPDVIDQGFGCMDDMVHMAKQHGFPLDDITKRLIEGVDFSNNYFGLELLRRSLSLTKQVSLWWD